MTNSFFIAIKILRIEEARNSTALYTRTFSIFCSKYPKKVLQVQYHALYFRVSSKKSYCSLSLFVFFLWNWRRHQMDEVCWFFKKLYLALCCNFGKYRKIRLLIRLRQWKKFLELLDNVMPVFRCYRLTIEFLTHVHWFQESFSNRSSLRLSFVLCLGSLRYHCLKSYPLWNH